MGVGEGGQARSGNVVLILFFTTHPPPPSPFPTHPHSPPGYELEPRTFDNLTSCTACPNGLYRSADMVACMACPVGTYEDGTHTGCVACPAGTYNNITAQYYNNTADPPNLGCLACPSLRVSGVGAGYCFGCWEKSPVTGAFYPQGGGANTWAAANGTACLACPEHLFINTTAAVNGTAPGCIRCPLGYYRLSNMTDCARTGPGMYMDDQGAARGATRRLMRDDPGFAQASLRKRSLAYLVHNMRRYLETASSSSNGTRYVDADGWMGRSIDVIAFRAKGDHHLLLFLFLRAKTGALEWAGMPDQETAWTLSSRPLWTVPGSPRAMRCSFTPSSLLSHSIAQPRPRLPHPVHAALVLSWHLQSRVRKHHLPGLLPWLLPAQRGAKRVHCLPLGLHHAGHGRPQRQCLRPRHPRRFCLPQQHDL